jgi:hypothetical protein
VDTAQSAQLQLGQEATVDLVEAVVAVVSLAEQGLLDKEIMVEQGLHKMALVAEAVVAARVALEVLDIET